jgi:hypothetical protein
VKRRKSRKSEAAVVADVGATLELSRRHEIVVGAGIRGGQRVRSRLERLIENAMSVPKLVMPVSGMAGIGRSAWPGGSICAKIYGKGALPGPLDQRCATTAHR